MSYPINDIFEGTADLLENHGVLELSTHNLDDGRAELYIKYGGYNYLVVYIDGTLSSINRREREDDHGKN